MVVVHQDAVVPCVLDQASQILMLLSETVNRLENGSMAAH